MTHTVSVSHHFATDEKREMLKKSFPRVSLRLAKRSRFVINPETLEKLDVQPLNPTAFLPKTEKKGAFYYSDKFG